MGSGQPLREVEGQARGRGERNREEEHQAPGELGNRLQLAVSRLLRK